MLTGISPDSLGPCRSGKDLGFKDVGEPLKEKKDEVTVTHVVVATPAGKRLISGPAMSVSRALKAPHFFS